MSTINQIEVNGTTYDIGGTKIVTSDSKTSLQVVTSLSNIQGDVRGNGAVDLQQYRNREDQIASGDYSITVGYGNTASGYNVKNTIYYNDKTYGKLRIVAMNSSIPLYSVIRIKNYDGYDIYAIVLDRGVGSGVIDLLVENESKASKLGIRKNIEIK